MNGHNLDLLKKSQKTTPLMDKACEVCGFLLHSPIQSLPVSDLVFYNDARFRGRCILALRLHRDQWEDIEEELLTAFVKDSQVAVRAIRQATGCARVNIALLSNTVAHAHLHLIPRFPAEEADPYRSPWRDQRPQEPLAEDKAQVIIAKITSFLPAKVG